MAEKLQEFDFSSTRRGAKYPFDEWFDGSIYKLVAGEDYKVKSPSMRAAIKRQADERKIEIDIKIVDDGIVLKAKPSGNGAAPARSRSRG